jgi:hypothetical protein
MLLTLLAVKVVLCLRIYVLVSAVAVVVTFRAFFCFLAALAVYMLLFLPIFILLLFTIVFFIYVFPLYLFISFCYAAYFHFTP